MSSARGRATRTSGLTSALSPCPRRTASACAIGFGQSRVVAENVDVFAPLAGDPHAPLKEINMKRLCLLATIAVAGALAAGPGVAAAAPASAGCRTGLS